jgi:ATP-dependent Clp protease ATP-binding subunit ClpA
MSSYGAKSIQHYIKNKIITPIANKHISGEITNGNVVFISSYLSNSYTKTHELEDFRNSILFTFE